MIDAVNTANTASTQQTLLIANPLTTASATGAGTVGAAMTLHLSADGGLLPYAWSVSSGAMPAGLTLNSTSGVITGTPAAAGTFSLTVAVTDSTQPAQVASLPVTVTIAPATLGTTWYVRADGGTPYTHNNPSGQCDGKADRAYPGSGVNQHCAFGDYRYLYDDQHTYPAPSVSTWVIAGGDTVIIDNTKPWRVGHDQGASSGDAWCSGTGNSVCYNPTIPSGTALQPTRILGRNAGNCSVNGRADASKMTQLFGGYGVYQTLNLGGTQYVDVECLEITSHTNCVVHGSPNPNPATLRYPSVTSLMMESTSIPLPPT